MQHNLVHVVTTGRVWNGSIPTPWFATLGLVKTRAQGGQGPQEVEAPVLLVVQGRSASSEARDLMSAPGLSLVVEFALAPTKDVTHATLHETHPLCLLVSRIGPTPAR